MYIYIPYVMGEVSRGAVFSFNHTLEPDLPRIQISSSRFGCQIFSLQNNAILKSSVFTFKILSVYQSSVFTNANLETS